MEATNSPSMTIDASVLIGLCARERDKYHIALAELEKYSEAGYRFYAPGVIVAEVLFVLCKKLTGDKTLTEATHAEAIEDFCDFMTMIEPPPNGDRSLIQRAEEIRRSYGCSRSADGLYIALAENLSAVGVAEILTFDAGFQNQSESNASSVKIRLLVPSPPPQT